MIKDYQLELCASSDIQELQTFIHNYWKPNHILAHNAQLMKWQHFDSKNGHYNFITAKHKSSGEIHGILGFIPTCQFDAEISDQDLWLAIWKARSDVGAPGLGLYLYYQLCHLKKPRSVSTLGLREDALLLYQNLGFQTGVLPRYYQVHSQKKKFQLIDGFDGRHYSAEPKRTSQIQLNKISQSEFERVSPQLNSFVEESLPQKTGRYFIQRYFLHPVYRYEVFGIYENAQLQGVMILRVDSYESACAIRWVDYFGDQKILGKIGSLIQDLLSAYKAEYIDFYQFGLSPQNLLNSGFLEQDSSSKVVIPNYFKPFVRKNVSLNYAFKTESRLPFRMFKGDCDQDRPNAV